MIVLFIPIIALLLLLTIPTPALACKPSKTVTQFGEADFPDSSNPGTIYLMNNIEYVVNAGGIGIGYWMGDPAYQGYYTTQTKNSLMINMDSSSSNYLTGCGIGNFKSTTDKGTYTFKYGGLNYFTYNGPPLKVVTSTGTTTISTGEVFFGDLMSGNIISHFTTGPLTGSMYIATYTGVAFPDGSSISTGTAYVAP